jgi:hypothetical protein
MPLISPHKNEKQYDFITRFMEKHSGEFKTKEQALAVAYKQFEGSLCSGSSASVDTCKFCNLCNNVKMTDEVADEPVKMATATEVPHKVVDNEEIAHIGTFFNSSSGKIIITRDLIDKWVATHGQMISAGLKTPLTLEHRGPGRGWVTGIKRDGNRMLATIDLVGEGITDRETHDYSIEAGTHMDGTGKKWENVLTGTALTLHPTIPGMKKGNTIRQYTMSLDKVIYQEIDMELKQLSELLGCDENIDQITTKINELKANQIVIKPEPEKITLSLVKENRSIKVNQLVSNGNITPATAKKLNDTICNQESVIKLSLTEPEVNRIIDEVIVALSLNKAIDLTERTGEQIAPDEKLLSDTRKTKDAEETFMKYYNNNLIPQNVK